MAKASNTIPLSQLQQDASTALKRVRKSRGPLVVTHGGKAAAALLSFDAYRKGGLFASPENRLMAAQVEAQGSVCEVGAVRPPLQIGTRTDQNAVMQDVASIPLTLAVNWPALLKK